MPYPSKQMLVMSSDYKRKLTARHFLIMRLMYMVIKNANWSVKSSTPRRHVHSHWGIFFQILLLQYKNISFLKTKHGTQDTHWPQCPWYGDPFLCRHQAPFAHSPAPRTTRGWFLGIYCKKHASPGVHRHPRVAFAFCDCHLRGCPEPNVPPASHLQVPGGLEGHEVRQELEEEDQRLLAAAVEAPCAPEGGLWGGWA